jgi:YVTN family beta-propeller protein
VSDETGGAIVVIDPAAGTVVHRIAVGKRPRGIRLSHDGTRLFVALSGSPIAGPGVDESTLPPADRAADGIGVVNLSTHAVERVLQSGQDPETFALSADGSTIFISNEETAEMSRLDVAKGEIVARVKVGEEPEGVGLRPDGREVYVTSEGDNAVAAVDVASNTVVAHIKTAARPRDVVFTRDGAVAFVTDENAAAVTVIDTAAHKVITTIKIPTSDRMPMPPRPMSAVLSPDGQQMFVSLGRASAIAVIDVATRAFVRAIEDVGTRPWGIAISGDGRTLYTANGPSGDVSIIDIAAGTVRQRIATGGSPWGVVVQEKGQ